VRQAQLIQASRPIRHGLWLTASPELNHAYEEVTNHAKPWGRSYVSHNACEGIEPEIILVALGQGFHFLEASTGARVRGECVSGVPGSKSVAGERTVCIGTWENRSVPFRSRQKAEKVMPRYVVPVVGPTHIRGVGGPGEDLQWGGNSICLDRLFRRGPRDLYRIAGAGLPRSVRGEGPR
jgi:hypothetical protein